MSPKLKYASLSKERKKVIKKISAHIAIIAKNRKKGKGIKTEKKKPKRRKNRLGFLKY